MPPSSSGRGVEFDMVDQMKVPSPPSPGTLCSKTVIESPRSPIKVDNSIALNFHLLHFT